MHSSVAEMEGRFVPIQKQGISFLSMLNRELSETGNRTRTKSFKSSLDTSLIGARQPWQRKLCNWIGDGRLILKSAEINVS